MSKSTEVKSNLLEMTFSVWGFACQPIADNLFNLFCSNNQIIPFNKIKFPKFFLLGNTLPYSRKMGWECRFMLTLNHSHADSTAPGFKPAFYKSAPHL